MTPMIPRQQIHTNGAWDYAYDEAAFSHSKTQGNHAILKNVKKTVADPIYVSISGTLPNLIRF
jgi:hypothetical protein